MRRGETMRRVRGQRQGGGSTAEEPVRAETRLGLKIHRSFSIRLLRAEKNHGGRSLNNLMEVNPALEARNVQLPIHSCEDLIRSTSGGS